MTPIKFDQATVTLAKAQPQYRPLPVCITPLEDVPGVNKYICKYELSDIEIAQIIATKSLFISQDGEFFHPILPQIESPFASLCITYIQHEDDSMECWIPLMGGGEERLSADDSLSLINVIMDRFPELTPELMFFTERLTSGIDEGGNIISL